MENIIEYDILPFYTNILLVLPVEKADERVNGEKGTTTVIFVGEHAVGHFIDVISVVFVARQRHSSPESIGVDWLVVTA